MGRYEAAYSGFEGQTEDGRSLVDVVHERGITEVDVTGIATDYCDKATALDARTNTFATRLLLSSTTGVAPDTTAVALEEMTTAGEIVADLPAA